MLIGIDMLGVQSPESGDRQSGRLGRQLVSALLAKAPAHRYVLYTHEGLPSRRIPSARNALRVSLASGPTGSSGLRPTIQRVLDRNPEGLDWMLLLDPFESSYRGMPPESPLNGLRVASLIADLAPTLADDRRLAPLRRHDAILAVSEATAADCRRRLGTASWRVKAIGVACDEDFAAPDVDEPLTRSSGDELERLGIAGPFLFASMAGGADRANLGGILDAYHRLPFEHRKRHQLVIAGVLDDPRGVVGYLHDHGCAEGLVLVGDVDERTLRTLYGRCSAFVSPSIEEGSGLALVEAMRCGAPVVAGRTGAQPEILGDAGMLVDPHDPARIADQITALLRDVDLERDYRKRALARSKCFSWEPVVQEILAVFRGDESPSPRPRYRVDRAHVARPRIAIFPDNSRDGSTLLSLGDRVPAGLRAACGIDLYLESGDSALIDGLPPEFGGFDARQFERNDDILGYHAVIYSLANASSLGSMLWRLRGRPGLLLLQDDRALDLIGPEAVEREAGVDVPGPATSPPMRDARDLHAERVSERLREVFLTSSIVLVESPHHLARIRAAMPEFADRLVEIPPGVAREPLSEATRLKRRAEYDFLPDSVLIGLFSPADADESSPMTTGLAEAITSAFPGVVILPIDGTPDGSAGSRSFDGREVGERDRDLISILDLAIHPGGSHRGASALLDLLRSGLPTIAFDSDLPESVVRHVPASSDPARLLEAVRDLALDADARSTLGRSARAYMLGSADATRASKVLMSQVERCAAELSRGVGRPRRGPSGRTRGLITTPHPLRPAPPSDEAISRSR